MKGLRRAVAVAGLWLFVLVPSQVQANAACELAAEEQAGLQREVASQRARLEALRGWVTGKPDLSFPVEDLFAINPLNPLDVAQFRRSASQRLAIGPDTTSTNCDRLDDSVIELRRERHLLQKSLDQMTGEFLYLPRSQRSMLLRIMTARVRQARATEQFIEAVRGLPAAALTIARINSSDNVIERRLATLPQALWALGAEQPESAEAVLMALWRAQQRQPVVVPDLDLELYNRLDSDQKQQWETLQEEFRTLQFVINEELVLLRSNIIDRSGIGHIIRLQGDEAGLKSEAAMESRALVRQVSGTLRWVWYSLPMDEQQPGERDWQQFFSDLLFAAFMFILFALAVRSASMIKRAMIRAHDALLRRGRSRRSLNTLSRIFSTLAPVLPWIVLWLALEWISLYIDRTRHPLLYWLLQPGIVYVIYRLLAELAEWLVLRVALGGGNYLGGSKSEQAGKRARRLALITALPWLLVYGVEMLIGASVLSTATSLFAWLAFYLVLGDLLAPQKAELVENCRQVLPEQFDGLLDRLRNWHLAQLWGPMLLPLVLANFVRDDLDRLLQDFDWYRSFSANVFRLKTGTDKSPDNTISETTGDRSYTSAILDPENTCGKFPFIDSGLIGALRKPLDAWLADHQQYNTLLMRGERGIGKTVALNRLACDLEANETDVQVRKLDIPKGCWHEDDIRAFFEESLELSLDDGPQGITALDKQETPSILMVDDAQNLFRASVGGLSGWRYFLSLTSVRLENVFWIVSINHQSFAYLSNVFGADFQFASVVQAKRWNQQDIRSLILSRNHQAGRRISYDELLLSRGPEAGNLRNAEQRYFALLWDACRGNPSVALHLWLDSVNSSGERVKAGPPKSLANLSISRLGDNLQFVYAAIVLHESLTSVDLCEVTSLPEPVVRYALKAGMDSGFVERTDEGQYSIKIATYQAVINHLARKNMLNE